MNSTLPQFPLYIPTKGRSQYMHTSIALTAMDVPHFLIVEPQEVEAYIQSVEQKGLMAEILPLDMSFKDQYDTCDDLGLSKSTGPGPARNFAWEHSKGRGHAWHWVMDDNIEWFFRFNYNLKTPCRHPAFFRAQEDFCLRYQNIAMAGPNYFMFASRKQKAPAFVTNTRIYSCNLIRNDVPFRWRGRYNEDTILSLDMLKADWCTVQFNAFLQYKMKTQIITGGNTDEFYWNEGSKEKGKRYADGGTSAKSQMLVNVHPDVSSLSDRFSREHHHVDYSGFRQKLKLKDGVKPQPGANEYGMRLKSVPHYKMGAS